jgi:hypothetical protein
MRQPEALDESQKSKDDTAREQDLEGCYRFFELIDGVYARWWIPRSRGSVLANCAESFASSQSA